jgi:hypothetical protein
VRIADVKAAIGAAGYPVRATGDIKIPVMEGGRDR